MPGKTKHSWLKIFHCTWSMRSDARYSLVAILFDLNNPKMIIALTRSWILTSQAAYEMMGSRGMFVLLANVSLLNIRMR